MRMNVSWHQRLLPTLGWPLSRPYVRTRSVSRPELSPDYWPTQGWQRADPGDLGLRSDMLAQFGERMVADWPHISSMAVIRNGYLAYEHYAGPINANTPTHLWSATKPFTSAAVGIAIREGYLSGVDQNIGDILGSRLHADVDKRVANITVHDLLTMRGGWQWRSGTDFRHLGDTADWCDRTLHLTLAHEPGQKFTYNSGGPHLLSAMIQARTGLPLRDYLEPRLFAPLGIDVAHWGMSPQGETAGAFDLHLTARDAAKLGYLYLNGGNWDGRQVVPKAWVDASLTQQVRPRAKDNLAGARGYGYFWWLDRVAGRAVFFALGYGEQLIYVIPSLDMVIMATVADTLPVEQLQRPRAIVQDLIKRVA